MPDLPPEMHSKILETFLEPYTHGEEGQPFSAMNHHLNDGKVALATRCTLVSTAFYDIATPLVWRDLLVRNAVDLGLFLDMVLKGPLRKQENDIGWYTRRIDIRLNGSYSTAQVLDLLQHLPRLKILNIWNRGHRRQWNTVGRYMNGLLVEIGAMCTKLVTLQLLSTAEKPTVREIAFISKNCPLLEILQTDEIAMGETKGLDAVLQDDWRGHRGLLYDLGIKQEPHSKLTFSFPSLKKLIIGAGGIGGSPTEQSNARLFMKMISQQPGSFPVLEQLQFLIPVEGIEPYLEIFQAQFRVAVARVGQGGNLSTYRLFPKIQTLSLFIVGWDAPPLSDARLHALTYVHIFPMGAGHLRGHVSAATIGQQRHDDRIDATTRYVIQQLGRKIYPNVKRITIWVCACMAEDGIRRTCEELGPMLLANGIRITMHRSPIYSVSPDGRFAEVGTT